MPGAARDFATTRWSVVLAAGNSTPAGAEALAVLCRVYWYPLYAYVRRQGHSQEDAQDLTQEFFARLLERDDLVSVAPERGRFRAWLLAVMKHFLAKEWARAHRIKRGGETPPVSLESVAVEERYAREPTDLATPELLYDRRLALDLLDRGLVRLEAEFVAAGKASHFTALKFCLTGEKIALREIAVTMGSTEGAIKVAVHRFRERYRALIREEIAGTVECPEEIEAELQELQVALRN
jgi:RNA polymerase sigma-70 factor (ECF subfamily)